MAKSLAKNTRAILVCLVSGYTLYDHNYAYTIPVQTIDPLGANEIHLSCRISPTHVSAILEA